MPDNRYRTCAGWRRAPHDAAGVIATNARDGAHLCRACWRRWSTDDELHDQANETSETRRNR